MAVHVEAFQHANVLSMVGPEAPLLELHGPGDVLDLMSDGFEAEVRLYAQGSSALGRPASIVEDPPFGRVFDISRETGKEGNRTSMNDRVARWGREGDTAAYRSMTAIQYRTSPNDVLSEHNFSDFAALARDVVESPRAFHTFRALNIYADLGKTNPVVRWARKSGVGHMDHDEIVVQLFEAEHDAARRRFLPSSYALEPDQLGPVETILRSGFHIAQVLNGQATPAHLLKFFSMSQGEKKLAIFSGICDIGGAQGDSIISGSPTITDSTYTLLRGVKDILLSTDFDGMPPEEAAAMAYESMLQFRGERFGGAQNGFAYDPTNPDMRTRAMIRMAMMFRGITPQQAAEMRAVFDSRFDPVTQALCLDFLNMTGFEGREAGGAVWSMYSSTTADKVLKSALRSQVPFSEAIETSMRIIARIHAAACRIDFSDADLTNVVAYDLAKAADEDWRQLLRYNIIANKISNTPGQARVFLDAKPAFEMEHVQQVADLGGLAVKGTSLWVGAGGGGDVYAAAFVALDVVGDRAPVFVSVWGDKDRMENATPLSDDPDETIFIAGPQTRHGMRLYEDKVARRIAEQEGLVFMVTKRDDMSVAFRRIADYLHRQGRTIDSINIVEAGGDMISASTLDKPGVKSSRDQESLRASLDLMAHLGITASHTFVAVPGEGAEPDMARVVKSTRPLWHRFTDRTAAALQEQMERDGLPSADRDRYSRMLNILWYATHRRTREEGAPMAQPLLLPVDQALARRGRGRPAFAGILPEMLGVLVFDSTQLGRRIGIFGKAPRKSPRG